MLTRLYTFLSMDEVWEFAWAFSLVLALLFCIGLIPEGRANAGAFGAVTGPSPYRAEPASRLGGSAVSIPFRKESSHV